MPVDARTYRCDCREGYEGALCDLQRQSAGWCGGLRCVHGQCERTEKADRCTCEEGFSGQSCDIGEHARTRANTPP